MSPHFIESAFYRHTGSPKFKNFKFQKHEENMEENNSDLLVKDTVVEEAKVLNFSFY